MDIKNVINALNYLDNNQPKNPVGAAEEKTEKPASESTVNVNVNVTVNFNENENENVNANEAAVFEKSKPAKYTPDAKRIQELIDEANRGTELLRQLVEKLLMKQGTTFQEAYGLIAAGQDVTVEVDEETRLKAQEEIGEDGYYGVKQTSQRILDFAKALSGGDPSKIDMLEEAFKKGFKMAEDLWGGKLPDISYDTYDAVMQGFDDWRKGTPAE